MNRIVKRTLVLAGALALCAGHDVLAQQPSKHVLHDVVSGKIAAPQLTVRTSPDAAPVTRRLPFFSTGPLLAAQAGPKNRRTT